MQSAFLLISLLSCILYVWGTGKKPTGLLVYLVWIAVIGTLSYIGFFQNTSSLPPRMLLVILPAVIFVTYAYKNTVTGALSYPFLLGIHILRIPVELSLYSLFLNGQVPEAMTFQGWNFDILMGVSAVLMLIVFFVKNTVILSSLFLWWNRIGILFLAIIVLTAILAAPSPLQVFGLEQPNVAILKFPYTLLPALVVPLVLLSHLLCLKAAKRGGD
ncbi:hypothetical protein [Pedobacter sp. BAL39]|uniref:hypothetical protein n=1 Tax=Pedobacter sp. BAL39 TaxID=391596 RepID=UPI0002E1CFAA|nr:hypothetical protein [Pedobacter sp. BAL39]